jgi:hypothetical protein
MEHLVRATLQPTMAQWAIEEAKTAYKAYKEAPADSDRYFSFILKNR